jgi:hypothetical protein
MPSPKIFLSALAVSVALAGASMSPVMAQSAKPKVAQKTAAAKSAKLRAARAKVSVTRICAPGQVRKAGRCASRDSVTDGSLRHPIILMPGQRFESAMPAMANPASLDLPLLENGTYYQIGGRVISVDNESRVILAVIEAAGK